LVFTIHQIKLLWVYRKEEKCKVGVVAHACNPSYQEVEIERGLWFEARLGKKFLSSHLN
jgi:hypothetical protein